MEDKKTHWNAVYESKDPTEVSWYEPLPETSLDLISSCNVEKDAAIIDIGGGDSYLAEYLIAKGFSDITVLDISEKAIERAKKRLGEKAAQIQWVVADAADYVTERKFDLWHDRAAFHFLIEEPQIKRYTETVKRAVKPGGYLIIGTFSEKGPSKCSGLDIRQYSIGQLQDLFSDSFLALSSKNIDHITPSGGTQNFTFCSFQKK